MDVTKAQKRKQVHMSYIYIFQAASDHQPGSVK